MSHVLAAPASTTGTAPALSIPSELLHAVFTFAVEPSSSDIDINEKNFIRLEVLSYSQVCQKWRLAARDCPVLWIHGIDFQSQPLEIIADLLPLSCPYPIAVGHRSAPLLIEDDRGISILHLLKHEAHRISEWNVTFQSSALKLDQLTALMRAREDWVSTSNRQPLLQRLRYTGGWTSLLWDLRQHAPDLRKLSISNSDREGFLPLQIEPSLKFHVLTELRVCNVPKLWRPVECEWLEILEGMPSLHLLALHNAMQYDRETAAGPLLNPSLPQLRFMSFREKDWSCVMAQIAVWCRLVVPGTCGVELGFPSTSQALLAEEFRDVLATLITDRILRGFDITTIPTAAETPHIEIDLRSTSTGCQFSYGTVRYPDLVLNWNEGHGTTGVIEYLDAHAASFPKFPPFSLVINDAASVDVDHVFDLTCDIFYKATSVRIHRDIGPSSHQSVEHVASTLPSRLLAQIPHLRVLRLDKSSSSILSRQSVPFLSQAAPGVSAQPLKSVILPKLQTIVLELDDEEGTGQGMSPEADRAVEEVKKYVRWREDRGFFVDFAVQTRMAAVVLRGLQEEQDYHELRP